jgi:transcriptional regulator with XRE-family HTH domain
VQWFGLLHMMAQTGKHLMQDNGFGAALKEWRGKRRMSQLDLALAANVSARHIAFLETGRSKPSRGMVMQLGETLSVPRGERNRLLDYAGYRAAWKKRPLDEAEMAPVAMAIRRMIERHAPFPAFVIDRHWVVSDANSTGIGILAALGVGIGQSLLDTFLEGGAAPDIIENWPDVGVHLLSRLKTENLHVGGDAVLEDAIAKLAQDPAVAAARNHGNLPAIVPARYRLGDQLFSVFTTIAQFGTAEDIALADLRIELIFPADAETEALFLAAASASA